MKANVVTPRALVTRTAGRPFTPSRRNASFAPRPATPRSATTGAGRTVRADDAAASCPRGAWWGAAGRDGACEAARGGAGAAGRAGGGSLVPGVTATTAPPSGGVAVVAPAPESVPPSEGSSGAGAGPQPSPTSGSAWTPSAIPGVDAGPPSWLPLVPAPLVTPLPFAFAVPSAFDPPGGAAIGPVFEPGVEPPGCRGPDAELLRIPRGGVDDLTAVAGCGAPTPE